MLCRTIPPCRARAIVGTALVLVLAVAGYAIYVSFRHVIQPPPAPGCQAGAGVQAITLDAEQAAIAATIAGVAARHRAAATRRHHRPTRLRCRNPSCIT